MLWNLSNAKIKLQGSSKQIYYQGSKVYKVIL